MRCGSGSAGGGFKGGAGSFPYLRQDLDQFLRQLARDSIANLTPQPTAPAFIELRTEPSRNERTLEERAVIIRLRGAAQP